MNTESKHSETVRELFEALAPYHKDCFLNATRGKIEVRYTSVGKSNFPLRIMICMFSAGQGKVLHAATFFLN